jgi:hypothetical protein
MSKFEIIQTYSRRRCILYDASAKIDESLEHLRGISHATYTVMLSPFLNKTGFVNQFWLMQLIQ